MKVFSNFRETRKLKKSSDMSPAKKFFTGVFLVMALYCGTDPLGHRPMALFGDFETYPVDLPPWGELPATGDPDNRLQKAEVKFLNQVQGPESVIFDQHGRGPYTGIADGRIVFWNGTSWTDFANTSPIRSEICNPKPSLLGYLKNEHICGRPLGLRFDKKTGDMYIADAYFGVLKVGPEGGLATRLASEVEGHPLRFTNDLDVDDEGNVYFTESSRIYQRRNYVQVVLTADNSGRLLKYDPVTKKTTVLVENLQNPNGVSLSRDHTFVVFTEGVQGRLSRYWLKGEKAGTSEVFVIMPGHPDNVRTNKKGEFWVAIHCRRTLFGHMFSKTPPRLKKLLLRLPIKAQYIYMKSVGGKHHGMVLKYSPTGELLEVLEDREGKVVRAVSEVEEHEGKLWLGSVLMPFIAVYSIE